MTIRFQNKGISEVSAPSTVSCVMDAAASAYVPVAIYPSKTGVLTATPAAIASNSTSWGITQEAVSTGSVTNICVGGKTKLAGGGGTDGQIIASIGANGTATTGAVSSATVLVGKGMMVGTNYAILY
jgi:hypothetical protein